MNNIGFKIVDKDEDIVIDILQEAKKKNHPVEVGLYGESKRVRKFCTTLEIPLNIHFNHIAYSLSELDKYKDLFFEEVKIAKSIGANYGIAHMAKYPMTGQAGYQNALIKEVINRMQRVEELSLEADFEVYIENTFESISFYRKVFYGLKERQIKHLNFCFDIGHAKVWSGNDFKSWMKFLIELKSLGFKLHFHLHSNRGLIDEHLSLMEAKAIGLYGNDGVFSDLTYEEMYREIFDKFPDERKIFEVKPHLAIENKNAIKQLLNI
jgi:hypothetical protein